MLASAAAIWGCGKTDGLPSIHRRRFGGPEASGAEGARPVFRPSARGIPTANDMWSLSKAFTSAFKDLHPIPQFKVTAKLGDFLENRFSQSF